MATWIKAKVIENRRWNKDLFSLVLDADVDPFIAGQFTKLGLEIDGKIIQRAYSFVNPPNSKYLEIYATRVADGLLSPRLHALEAGETALITKEASGFFTLDEIPKGEDLWMLSTGTAIGPFLSILQQDEVWQRFRKVVLVHAVRFSADLSYQAEINGLKQKRSDQIIVQPFVSREPKAGALSGRITHALEDGLLERVVGLKLTAEKSQVMLCGNPQMVKDVRAILLDKGLEKNLRRKPGNITTEQYW
ncbi:ferredoxin--NADP reductase [Grimontia hollisae]|uniref:ferredoxin--NADP(+) reductase n=2 Tax=Grimontia hollisae TaxID=673 RepID=D0I3W9_GRIHO|nr:ferredoxin--NADP reductase [Grimontia hollisae]AMG30429.1 ferredoxin--NADP reductase [Grimontia hollisae]EEY73747.1 ferredoxin--NADP(+) reductase [Grimontia hollisae CIP 101886]MDF2183858.1 ferredoxin--NADP reductase [Grimontia hollisae]STO41986.1 Ferredoxin--NADP reductase [Grimontia hollisae]STO55911.1 Ferredoxin--NADP reductase [Grimontia hollisae]